MTLTISAKALGELAYPNFCPRCFWIKMHCRLPFQMFPSIFGHIDRYTKKVFHAYIDKHGKLPDWLSELGDVVGYVDPPHWKRYKVTVDEYNVTLRGEADAIFVLKDNSYIIGDYKTAKFKGKGDGLLPIYETQLNAYAYIGERLGYRPVTKIALIYMEPNTEENVASEERTILDDGFTMDFTGHILEIELDPENKIPPLLEKAREIFDMEHPPEQTKGCSDCKRLMDLIDAQSTSDQKTLFEF